MLSPWHLHSFVRDRSQHLRDEAERERRLREVIPPFRTRLALAFISLAHRLEPRFDEPKNLSSSA